MDPLTGADYKKKMEKEEVTWHLWQREEKKTPHKLKYGFLILLTFYFQSLKMFMLNLSSCKIMSI